jgi:energy-coupling factor transporter ATP-binding protein EcfA2
MENLESNLKDTKKKMGPAERFMAEQTLKEAKLRNEMAKYEATNKMNPNSILAHKENGGLAGLRDRAKEISPAASLCSFVSSTVKTGLPFIHPEFDNFFRLAKGELVLIVAYTGQGKSTIGYNLANHAIDNGKKALFIVNEESIASYKRNIYLSRIGVMGGEFLGIHSGAKLLANGKLASTVKQAVAEGNAAKDGCPIGISKEIDDHIEVFDVAASYGLTRKADGILSLLDEVAELPVEERPDMVYIDYLQCIEHCDAIKFDSHYQLMEFFCNAVKNKINTLPFPVIICAQAHSDDKRKGDALDNRIIGGNSAGRPATIHIEVKANKADWSTEFIIKKNRNFQKEGKFKLSFKSGKFVDFDANYAQMKQSEFILATTYGAADDQEDGE